MKQRGSKNYTEIFSGALWPQRKRWRRAAHLLPAKACLLVIDPKNKKQAQLLHKIARSFRQKGREVLIWQPHP